MDIFLFGRQGYKGFVSAKGSKSFMINFIHDFSSSCILNPVTEHLIPFILFLLFINLYCFIKIFPHTFILFHKSAPNPIVCKTLLIAHPFLDRALLANSVAHLPRDLENIFCRLSSLPAGAKTFIFFSAPKDPNAIQEAEPLANLPA